MVKYKSLLKYSLREIFSSFSRFISIVLIVMLGVAIFVGVSATGPLMRDTVDRYFKDYERPDQILQSSIGFEEEDVDVLREELEEEIKVQPVYFEDAFMQDPYQLVRVYGLPDDKKASSFPQFKLIEGRLPEKEGELALDAQEMARQNLKIGDQVRFQKADNENLDRLDDQAYTLVGFVDSPLYIENGFRGYTNLGDGSLDAFALVSGSDFDFDVYQQVFINYPSSSDLDGFSDEYLDDMAQKNEQIKDILKSPIDSRHDKLTSDLKAEIKKGKDHLDQGRQDLSDQEQALASFREELEKKGLLDLDPSKLPPAASKQVEGYQEAEQSFQKEKKKAIEDFNQAELDIEEAEQTLADLQEVKLDVLDYSDDPAYDGYKKNSERISALAKVFPVFFLLVAVLVTLTTMTRMVDEGRQEIGILKSFGYNNGQIMFKYLFYAGLAGLLGWSLGLLGYLIFPTVIYNAYGSLYRLPDLVIRSYPSLTLLSLLAALLATLGASGSALSASLKERPAEMLRAKAPKAGQRILLEKIPALWQSLSFNYKITFRNLFRYKRRMWMTILGIAGCMALILMGFGVSNSVNDIKDRQYGVIEQYDGVVQLNSDLKADEYNHYLDVLVEDDDIKDYLQFANVEAETTLQEGSKQDLSLMIPKNPTSFTDYKHLYSIKNKEEVELPQEGVLITQKLAELLRLKKGDRIDLSLAEEEATYSFQVADVVENYQGHLVYMQSDEFQRVTGHQLGWNQTFLKFDSEKEEGVMERLAQEDAVAGVVSMSHVEDVFSDSLSSLDIVVVVLTVAAALLAFVVLYNLTQVNIAERQKELATIKVLGFYDHEVSMYIFRENICLTLLGIVLGAVLGIFLHRYTVLVVEFDDLMFGRTIHASSYLYASLLTLFFSILVMLVMHVKLKKTNMMDALKED